MNARRIVPLLCAAVFLLSNCGKKYVTLQNKFPRGEERRYHLSLKTAGSSKISGLPGQSGPAVSPIKTDTELTYSMMVRDVEANGNAVMETSFDDFSSGTESGEIKMRIRAGRNGAELMQGASVIRDAPGLDALKSRFANPATVIMTPRGEILSISGPGKEGALAPHTDIPALLSQGQCLLPEGPVAPGGSWSEKRAIIPGETGGPAIPALDNVKLDIVYTFEGWTDAAGPRCAEISARGGIDVRDLAMDSSPARGYAGDVKTTLDRLEQTLTGVIHFDQDRGMLRDMHLESRQEMSVTSRPAAVEQGGEFRVQTEMKMVLNLKLLD